MVNIVGALCDLMGVIAEPRTVPPGRSVAGPVPAHDPVDWFVHPEEVQSKLIWLDVVS